jgi:prophage maintenance system killer protein
MAGLLEANDRMHEDDPDPVLKTAATAFGFVYIHPFENGNGRVHRCLIHHVLAYTGISTARKPRSFYTPMCGAQWMRICLARSTTSVIITTRYDESWMLPKCRMGLPKTW